VHPWNGVQELETGVDHRALDLPWLVFVYGGVMQKVMLQHICLSQVLSSYDEVHQV
jgi:hypothetical protein